MVEGGQWTIAARVTDFRKDPTLTARRFTRWYPDERRKTVAAAIDHQIVLAAEADKLGGWITYLIRDPSRPDFRGNAAGYPIYIGQSKNFSTRVLRRFLTSEKKATKKDSIDKRVSDLLHQNIVVEYEVLERVPTHLASLVSETNWVIRCRNRGYNLANQWAEQKSGGELIDRHGVPHERLWPFTLEEALDDDISVYLQCRRCALRHRFDLHRLKGLDTPPRTLGEIKSNSEIVSGKCHSCGSQATRYVKLEV